MTSTDKQTFWAVVNGSGEILHQFPLSRYEDQAQANLHRARQMYPLAGCKLTQVEK